MDFNSSIYYGHIIKGDLHGALGYIKQFPEQRMLYDRFVSVFEKEQYLSYDVDADLNDILRAYQQYYRDVFYLNIGREQCAERLRDRLAEILGTADEDLSLCDLEQNRLVEVFLRRGLHFLGGKSSGWYGPYVWRTTETVSYDVELPDGIQTYAVKLLNGFISRSWIDYLSFGEIGPGGWADGDGCINCVKSAWDLDSESFQISLLKHEAQHTRDLQIDPHMSSENLEYRAKLVELIYSEERNLLEAFSREADPNDQNNGHAMAAYRIMKGFADFLGVDEIDFSSISIEQIQAVARLLFDNSSQERIV